MQLCRAAYHVFESRRDVDHFIAISFCKANADFPSRSRQSDARCFGVVLNAAKSRWREMSLPRRAASAAISA
jgi:hypothetical protein